MIENHDVYESKDMSRPVYERDNPKSSTLVLLPRIKYTSSINDEQRELLSGMHTDMILALREGLKALKPKIRDGLLIEGRLIKDRAQFERLKAHPLHQFYLLAREHISLNDSHKGKMQYALPNGLDITADQARIYSQMRYNSTSLSKELGFETVWYPAQQLIHIPYNFKEAEKSAQSLLGGVNEFRIGTNVLPGGFLRLVKSKLEETFLKAQSDVVTSKWSLPDIIISKIANIVDL